MPENRQTDDQRIISVFSLLEWGQKAYLNMQHLEDHLPSV